MSIQTFTTVYDQLFIENQLYFRHNGAPFICHYNSALFSPKCPLPEISPSSPNAIGKEEKPYHIIFVVFPTLKPLKSSQGQGQKCAKKMMQIKIRLQTIFIRHLARIEAQNVMI